MTAGRLFSRDELLDGRLDRNRRARKLVNALESRVRYMRQETRRALGAYFSGSFQDYSRSLDRDYLASVRARATADDVLAPEDFERCVSQWSALVPEDPHLRAALLRGLTRRFSLTRKRSPRSLAALGADDPAVREAYERDNGESPDVATSPAVEAGSPGSRPAPVASVVGGLTAEAEQMAEWVTLPGGAVLFEPGEAADWLYILVSGRVRVRQPEDSGMAAEAEVTRGQVVGELEVLTGDPRSSSAHAARDSELIALPREGVLELARRHPEVMLRINRELAGRVGARRRRTDRAVSLTVALVALDPGVPLHSVAETLREALGGIGGVAHLFSREVQGRFPEAWDRRDEDDAELLAWLSEEESRHRFVLYEADPDPTRWTERCIRQADRVLLVASAASHPGPRQIEAHLSDRAVRPATDLLLLQDGKAAPPRLPWLSERQVRIHECLRPGDEAGFDRLARRLSGTAVGLVLGGGGGRGCAHLGILLAMQERGLPVDVVGGTSIGALVGGGAALGRDAYQIRAQLLSTARSRRTYIDPTLPFSAFLAGGKLSRVLMEQFGSHRIEDLPLPYFCVSSNLTRADQVVHERGELWRAVRASAAIPGVFPPMLDEEGQLLVDGGLLNGLPVDVMRAREDVGTVIGVNVSLARAAMRDFNFGESISGWRALRDRVLRRTQGMQAPTLIDLIMRSTELRTASGFQAEEARRLADVLIEPPVAGIPTLDFRRIDDLMALGHQEATTVLDAWLAEEPALLQQLRRDPAVGVLAP